MSRSLPFLTTILVSLLVLAFAACGDGETTPAGEETSTPAGATSTATGATSTATEGSPTQAAGRTPVGPVFTGSATATVTIADQTFVFENGRCDIGPDEAWLSVNIGQAGSTEYFRLLVGANPAVAEGARPVSGGGVFSDGEIALSGTKGDTTFLVGGVEGDTVTVDADLKSGDFQGTTVEGEPISGSFQC
jgi:hypothetical protein